MMPATLSIERTSGLGHTAAAGAPSEAMSGAADVEEEEEPASAAGARLLNIGNGCWQFCEPRPRQRNTDEAC